MKHGRKLTRKQKELIQELGLNPNNWLLIKNLPDKLVLKHRDKGTISEIELYEGQAV